MKAKKNILSLIFLMSFWSYSQFSDVTEPENYSIHIDSLKAIDSFDSLDYDAMSFCGGHLIGYYLDSNLVYITSTYAAETGYSSLFIYVKDDKPLKIKYHQHFAEWDKYHSKYPNGEGEYGSSYEHMTFTDTTYFIYIEQKAMKKFSLDQFIDNQFDLKVFNECLKCYRSMALELKGKQEDALELIKGK